jgi:hypothetical protein
METSLNIMETREKLIHDLCIIGIKGSTFQPHDGYTWSRFYEENDAFRSTYPAIELDLLDSERVICSTVLDLDNYSVITTRKLMTKENGKLSAAYFGSFKLKGYVILRDIGDKKPLTYGSVTLENGDELRYFVETSYASMIMTHGMKTRLEAEKMTESEIRKVADIWKRQYENR